MFSAMYLAGNDGQHIVWEQVILLSVHVSCSQFRCRWENLERKAHSIKTLRQTSHSPPESESALTMKSYYIIRLLTDFFGCVMLSLYFLAQFFKMLDLYIRDICLFFGSIMIPILPLLCRIVLTFSHRLRSFGQLIWALSA